MYFDAIKTALKISLTIILFITLAAVVVTLITSKSPILGGIRSFVVLSGSMDPSLPLGSIVYTQKGNYQVGDVISFSLRSVTVTHRIVAVQTEGKKQLYQTKGDANKGADNELVSESQIVGKQVYRVLNAGKLIVFLKTVPGFLSLIILPTLIFVGFEFWNIKKEFEKEVRKKVIKQLGMNEQI